MTRPKVRDTRRLTYGSYEIPVRSVYTPEESYKTVELPLMVLAELGLKAHTIDGELVIEKMACDHQNTTEVGEFMLTGYDCDDCGERLYS